MKKFLFLLIFGLGLSAATMPNDVVNQSTGNVTISNSGDGQTFINNGAAVTYTLSATAKDFSCTVINNGTGAINFSKPVKVSSTKTITVLGQYPTGMDANFNGNRIKLALVSGVWVAI